MKITEQLLSGIEKVDTPTLNNFSQQLTQFEQELDQHSTLDNTTKKQALLDLLNYLYEEKSEQEIVKKKQEILNLSLQTITSQLKNTILESHELPQNYGKTFVEYLQENPTTAQTIESFLKAPETLETWSQKIEHIRGDFVLGSLDPQLQAKFIEEPGLLSNIKSGLSLYFTDRLNGLSSHELEEVSKVGVGFSGVIGSANKLFDIVKNLGSFSEQMKSISTISEGMDVYVSLLTSNSDQENISHLQAFQSPEGFTKLLKKHTLGQGMKKPEGIQSFDYYFTLDQQTKVDSKSIINQLGSSYTSNAHKLMTQVLHLGPQVLNARSSLKESFGGLYDQISEVVSSLSLLTGGKTLAEMVKGTWLEGPLNFVASLVGFGSLSNYERRNQIKRLTKNCPDSQKKGLQQVVNYISNPAHDRGHSGQIFSSIFSHINPELYNGGEKPLNQTQLLNQLPNENFLKQAILDSLQGDTPLFISPTWLQNANISNYQNYFTKDNLGRVIINPHTAEEYKKMITQHIDTILQVAWVGQQGLFRPQTIIDFLKAGKGKTELSIYLLSGLSFPTYALDITASNFLSINSNPASSPSFLQEDIQSKSNQENQDSKTSDIVSEEELSITKGNGKIIYEFLANHKKLLSGEILKNHHIAAIMGNAYHESRFQPTAVGDTHLSSNSQGLFQWRESRLQNLKNYANTHNKDRKNINTQLDYFLVEFQDPSSWGKGSLEGFLKTNSLESATKYFDSYFERSNGKAVNQRILAAYSLNGKINSSFS